MVPCFFCTSESLKRKKARRSTMARRPLGSNRRQKGARKHKDHPSILSRWQNDEQYRTSRLAMGWTETSCRYLDYLTKIDISHHAPYHQRSHYESTITMKSNDPNPQSEPMWKREDYRATTIALLSLREEQGRTNTKIPKNMRTRQEDTLDPELQRKLEWLSPNWKTFF